MDSTIPEHSNPGIRGGLGGLSIFPWRTIRSTKFKPLEWFQSYGINEKGVETMTIYMIFSVTIIRLFRDCVQASTNLAML